MASSSSSAHPCERIENRAKSARTFCDPCVTTVVIRLSHDGIRRCGITYTRTSPQKQIIFARECEQPRFSQYTRADGPARVLRLSFSKARHRLFISRIISRINAMSSELPEGGLYVEVNKEDLVGAPPGVFEFLLNLHRKRDRIGYQDQCIRRSGERS